MEIVCKNHLLESNIEEVIFKLINNNNLALIKFRDQKKDKRVPTQYFLKKYKNKFLHPYFTNQTIIINSKNHTVEYSTFNELTKIIVKIINLFITNYPLLQSITIKPSTNYIKINSQKKIPIILSSLSKKITYLDANNFNELLQIKEYDSTFKYSDGFLLKQSINVDTFTKTIILNEVTPKENKIIQQINEDKSSMYIKYINSIVGFGVFASHDIKAKEFVACYKGEYTNEVRENTDYLFNIKKNFLNHSMDAKKTGNLTRFINHSSNKKLTDICNAYDFEIEVTMQANLQCKSFNYLGLSFIYFIAKRDIKAHEQLLFNYGDQYWTMGRPEHVFLNKNKILTKHGDIYKELYFLPRDGLNYLYASGNIKLYQLILLQPKLCFIIFLCFIYLTVS